MCREAEQVSNDLESRPPVAALWLLNLFFSPRRFFNYFPVFVTSYSTLYTALIVGLSAAIDQVGQEALKQELGGTSGLSDSALTSWTSYWALCAVAGLVGALFIYSIGGWWYRARLAASGASNPDARLARRVYVFASLVYALPQVLFTLLDTLNYPTPLAADRAAPWYWIAAILFLFWSLCVSYRGVRTLFEVVRWKARLWFFFLPCGFYLVLIGGLAVLFALFAQSVPPDLNSTTRLERPGYTVECPGNWWITETPENAESYNTLSIEPYQDALMTVQIIEERWDAATVVEEYLAESRPDIIGGITNLSTWGQYNGSGAQFIGSQDGVQWRVRFFIFGNATRTITVEEFAEISATDKVEPGFALIRRSFRLLE